MIKIYLNKSASSFGGPQIWARRFSNILLKRGFQVTERLRSEWTAAYFINKTSGIENALLQQEKVGFRVAGGYLPEWFNSMGRVMQRTHHAANAAITQALEIAGFVFYQSEWVKKTLDQNLLPRSDRYTIIYNGVDIEEFSPPVSPQKGIPIIGTVGRLRYRYRLQTLFEMSMRLRIPHRLLIVGGMDNECKEVYRRYMSNPKLREITTYHDNLPQEFMPDIYRKMNLLVHPVCGDSCPNVVVEAMACGVPVVAPRYGGTAELVREGGIIFDCVPWNYGEDFIQPFSLAVHDCLEQSLSLSKIARQLAIEHFNIEDMTDVYLESLGLPVSSPRPISIAYEIKSSLSTRSKLSDLIRKPRFTVAMAVRKVKLIQRSRIYGPPKTKPRIAFTLYDFQVGGIENWLYRLSKQLASEFEFHFLATKFPVALQKFHQVGTFAYLPEPIQMIKYFRDNDIDIVQVHNERWPADAALAAGVRFIIERTDGTRSCTRVPKHGFDLVIASSKGTIPFIAQSYPEEKIVHIYNGVDLNEIDDAPDRRLWGEEAFVIGRTSRFGRGKNLTILIYAMQRLIQDFPQAKLLLIGGDSPLSGAEPMERLLREQARNIEMSVKILESQDDPIPWIKGFNIGICVSQPGNEGIPNSLIEAMACSKPVISTNIDQIDELVVDGYNGILIPPDNIDTLLQAITALITNPDLCRQMGAAGRQTVEEKFTVQNSAQKYADIYFKLLNTYPL